MNASARPGAEISKDGVGSGRVGESGAFAANNVMHWLSETGISPHTARKRIMNIQTQCEPARRRACAHAMTTHAVTHILAVDVGTRR